ncbi:hypothetical protein [Pseudomonas sp. L5B5]|uniref:hypothetical protein n=1 Tax=Pseudomonas sp. L5B5 TaxID=2883205 RepID=UPI000731BCD6|nr:hypothetical protein [Pseudomonas sp. L5B5]KTC41001.1 hypothetical protein AO265_08735 [Pseudomonas sp. ABAC61]UCZ83988.1 hypothetical protein LGQ10_27210 [Pseudomonas sp. L5B5]
MKTLDISNAHSLTYSDLDENLRRGLKSSDPLVFSVLESVSALHQQHVGALEEHRANVGMIQYGSAFPSQLTGKIVSDLQARGRVSPVDFINANAGAPLSICCTRYGFQGPTLVLTMPEATSRPIADSLAQHWLQSGQAEYLFLCRADFEPDRGIEVQTRLVCL